MILLCPTLKLVRESIQLHIEINRSKVERFFPDDVNDQSSSVGINARFTSLLPLP
jgi:hypothetical protein